MTDRNTIYQGLSNAAWGYFFITLDLNLNGVSVLPRFVGFLLLYSAIGRLSGERRDLKLLRPLCMLLFCASFIDWGLSWLGEDIGSYFPFALFLTMLVTAASLYFHFQFLTDMAALATQYQSEGEDLDQRLLRHRTAYTVLTTVVSLVVSLARQFSWEGWDWVAGALAVVGFVVALMVIWDLFSLRKCVSGEGPRLE